MDIQASPSNERDLLALVVREVETRLPDDWDVVSVRQPAPRGPDAFLTVTAPDGAAARFIVEIKANLDPRNALYALDQLRSYRDWLEVDEPDAKPGFLVVSHYISPRARDMIAEAGASYADATGNLRLRSDRPAVFIDSRGAKKNPWPADRQRETKTLRGIPAARVVRALSDWRPPVKAADLAERAGTSIGATYRVLDLLDREALIVRRGKGEVIEVSWPDLLRRWSQDYDFAARNRTATFIAARGLPEVQERLRSMTGLRYAVTGSLAAARYAPYAEARLGAVYVDDVETSASQLGLRPADKGANLVLAEPFDYVVYQRASLQDGVWYSAVTQAAVDLLTGPGRNPAEGQELIRWMEENEGAWRI